MVIRKVVGARFNTFYTRGYVITTNYIYSLIAQQIIK